MKGRKAIPFKKLLGTERKGRINTEAPTPEAATPNAPHGLTPRAVEWFGRLTSRLEVMGCASASHTEMLALLSRRLAEVETCDELIAQHGEVYEATTDKGGFMLKANPAVAMRSEAMRHAQSLLAEFGLSLAAISKVKTLKSAPQQSTWGAFGS